MYEIPKITEEQAAIIQECIDSGEGNMRFILRLNSGEFACVEEKDIGDFVIAFLTKQFEVVKDEIGVGDWVSYSVSAFPEDLIEYGEIESFYEEIFDRKVYKIKDKYEISGFSIIKKLSEDEKELAIEEEIYRKIHGLNIDEKYSILKKIREIRESYENSSSTIY